MSKFTMAMVAALAISVGFNSVASASDYKNEYCNETKVTWQFKKVITYKTIIDYRMERQAFTKWVTEYDHCDKPIQVKKTFYKNIEVPFEKVVPMINWVKVKVVHHTGYGY